MHPPGVREQAERLIAAGVNDCEISRRIGVSRRTILEWRRPSYARRTPVAICPRCWQASKPMAFTASDYSELLALYLGDGCISMGPRTSRLRIALDAKYPQIIEEGRQLLERCFLGNGIGVQRVPKHNHVYLSVYSRHLVCLFPQHGSGPKHKRRIALESWQLDRVTEAPWAFLRGCIRSDGCAFINRTGPYEYLSYDFSGKSKDIIGLFAVACDIAGIHDYRLNGPTKRGLWDVRINRRASVARMLEHVGLKA